MPAELRTRKLLRSQAFPVLPDGQPTRTVQPDPVADHPYRSGHKRPPTSAYGSYRSDGCCSAGEFPGLGTAPVVVCRVVVRSATRGRGRGRERVGLAARLPASAACSAIVADKIPPPELAKRRR